ncbi:MAG: cupin domain-containing protein [Pseudomonadota bacterium]
MKKVRVAQKFAQFSEYWTPKIVGELNGQYVKLAKFKGDFVMHQHEREDELFFVLEGVLMIELEDQTLQINAGEFVIIPCGVKHRPYAHEEVHVMLLEPASTLNTGDADSELTVSKPEHI